MLRLGPRRAQQKLRHGREHEHESASAMRHGRRVRWRELRVRQLVRRGQHVWGHVLHVAQHGMRLPQQLLRACATAKQRYKRELRPCVTTQMSFTTYRAHVTLEAPSPAEDTW